MSKKRKCKRLRNPFQEYIDTTRAAWIGFNERFSHDWLSTLTDVDMLRRIWTSEAPRFTFRAMWDTRRLIPCDEVQAEEMYRRTLDANKHLIEYFVQFNTVPFDLEMQVQDNQRRASIMAELLAEESRVLFSSS